MAPGCEGRAGCGVEMRGVLVWFSSFPSLSCSMVPVCMPSPSREREATGFRLGLLRFLTRLSVLLNMPAVFRSCGSGCSGSSGSDFVAKGSTLRNEPESLSKVTGDMMLLERGGCWNAALDDDDVEETDSFRLPTTGSVDILVSSVSEVSEHDVCDRDLRESWTMQGFPEKTTETTRAVSWQGDGCSCSSCVCSLSEL